MVVAAKTRKCDLCGKKKPIGKFAWTTPRIRQDRVIVSWRKRRCNNCNAKRHKALNDWSGLVGTTG